MPSDTGAPHEYPYMVDGDPLANVADIMRTLAERIEFIEGQRGYVDVNVAAAAAGTVAVVFPIAFIDPPHVQVTSSSTTLIGTADTITATGMNVGVRHINGTNVTGTFRVYWRAYPAST